VIQRGESLASLLYLAALYAAIRAAEGPRAGLWTALSIAASALAMGTKEVAVTIPLLVALYDRTFLYGSFREMLRRRGALYAGLAATMVIPFVLVARVPGGEATGFVQGVASLSPGRYALTQCAIVVHYLRLALVPWPLVIDYRWPPAVSFGEVAPQAILLALLLAATLAALRRWSPIGFLGAAFFAILAPTSSFLPIADLAFEHRMYLPLAAVVLLAVLAVDRLLGRRAPDWARAAAVGAVAIALGLATVRRNEDYRSALSIWTDTAEKRPANARAQFNLGVALEQAGRADEALARYAEAVRLAPDYPDARVNLGLALVRQKRVEEGIVHYRRAVELQPDHAVAWFDLGMALAEVGRNPEALSAFDKAIALRPAYADAHNQRGTVFFATGRIEEARAEFEAAVAARPDFAEAQYNLGLALYRLGRKEEAERRFRRPCA
jgi:tetratricopeptide (TPR) repeat protein